MDYKRYLDTTIGLPAAQSIPTPAFRAGDFSAAIAAAGNENLGTDPLGRTILAAMICDPNTRSTTPNGQNLY